MQSSPGISRRRLVWGATALFAAFVAGVFLWMSCPCDLDWYHLYGRTARDSSLAGLYQAHNVEYPPLAIGLIVATEELAVRVPDPGLLARFNVYNHPSGDFRRFKLVYRLLMAGCTLATWGMVVALLRRHFGHELPREWLERLLVFALSLWPLGYVLLDRLDIGLTCLTLLATLLLLSRRHWAWSLAVLAAAINFKFVPVGLVPAWLLASLPGCTLGGWGRLVAGCGIRAVVLGSFLMAFTLPMFWFAGPECLNYFTYHAERGIEFQSNYAGVLTLLRHLDYPVQTISRWGSAVLECSAAPLLRQLSAGLVAGSLLAGALVLLVTRSRQAELGAMPADPPLVLGHLLWALLVFVLFNKTFSPQYILWLVPLVALVPLAGWRRRCFQLGFLGVACLTMLIYPRWMEEVVGTYPSASDHSWSTGATPLGTSLLLGRALLLLLLTAGLGRELLRRASGAVPITSAG